MTAGVVFTQGSGGPRRTAGESERGVKDLRAGPAALLGGFSPLLDTGAKRGTRRPRGKRDQTAGLRRSKNSISNNIPKELKFRLPPHPPLHLPTRIPLPHWSLILSAVNEAVREPVRQFRVK